MMTIHLVLLLLALVCFFCAAVPVTSRVNLTAAGLALWILSLLIG